MIDKAYTQSESGVKAFFLCRVNFMGRRLLVCGTLEQVRAMLTVMLPERFAERVA